MTRAIDRAADVFKLALMPEIETFEILLKGLASDELTHHGPEHRYDAVPMHRAGSVTTRWMPTSHSSFRGSA